MEILVKSLQDHILRSSFFLAIYVIVPTIQQVLSLKSVVKYNEQPLLFKFAINLAYLKLTRLEQRRLATNLLYRNAVQLYTQLLQ